jgi:hypothetical protein
MPDEVPTNTPPPAPAGETNPAVATPPPEAKVDPKVQLEKMWADFKDPEGYDKTKFQDAKDFAKKLGLPPQAAVVLAEREKALSAKEDAEYKYLQEKGWLEELQKDKELGGEKSRETMVDVMRAHDKLPPETQQMIKEHGVLYNPVVVRILHAIGKQQKEDTFVRPGAAPGQEQKKSLDERLIGLFNK